MGSKIEYVESSQIYAAKYVRNSKAVGVLWGIFTICYTIINAVAFITPEWLSETSESDSQSRLGLWSKCTIGANHLGSEHCEGIFNYVHSFESPYQQIAALLGLTSALLSVLTVFALMLFFVCTSTTVYRICGWIQLLSAFCLILTVVVYPFGWETSEIQQVCGSARPYYPGECKIGWAYYLAVIGCLDAVVLSTLAFILAARHVKLLPEPLYGTNGSLYKGEINSAYIGDTGSTAGSRKSLNLHPIMLMPQPMTEIDRFSEISARTGRSKLSTYRPDFSSNIQNFQL